ncbi:MAG: hypothetical protein KC478_07725 [Bacteriovoracaceae bacterium]|nr:hypothetical protein [Bacteriovoracaceae bacterium]
MQPKVLIEISDLVMKSAESLEVRLADLLKFDSEKEKFKSQGVDAAAIHNFNGFSGYNFWVDGNLTAHLQLSSLTSGYYVFWKKVNLEDSVHETYDYYNQDGEFVYAAQSLDGQSVFYNSINMEPSSPFINHLYNILHVQYEQAESGMSETKRIALIESTLNAFLKDSELFIGAQLRRKDPALVNIVNEIHRVEKDPVLNWDERQRVFSSLKQVRKKILRTKSRAHNFNGLLYNTPVALYDAKVKLDVIKKRPINNLFGIFKKHTWGRFVWFANTVKENLGFSVAMAIYGPFTFYFISQPMNPHAMWAVGKVRGAYINVVDSLTMEEDQNLLIAQAMDQVSTKQSGIAKIPAVGPHEDWSSRMSSFKAMQIAYEESMVFAARMGRIEQMENQFMFPLTAESAWEEMERYLRNVKGTLEFNTNLDARYKKFLEDEIERTHALQVYIWRKTAQFFNDHPYVVVDQENEQPGKDYYVGRGFVFMEKMTNKLAAMDLADVPITHEKVQKLSNKYKKLKRDGESVMETLARNTKLFRQKDIYDTDELRDNLRRHWEVLFLQQNKKQEASSFALQAYTWSVKNAIWILQSLYSAKREELANLTFKYNLDNQNTDKTTSDKNIDQMYESLMNMLVLEYVSISKEIANNLPNDTEGLQRKAVIENVKEYLNQRDRLFNRKLRMANSKTSTKTI